MKKTRSVATLSLISLAFSCATARPWKNQTPDQLFQAVCAQGGNFSEVTGSIWAKVESRELKGQFPATFRARSDQSLALEITDLIGTPQAWLRLSPGHAPEFRLSPENRQKYGNGNYEAAWAGLPFEFAPSLFLGKMPCPSARKDRTRTMAVTSDGGLQLREFDLKTHQTAIYAWSFMDYGGVPWSDHLDYRVERDGTPLSEVHLTFVDPADPGAYPKRWTAESPQGSIQVRWKDRATKP